MHTRSTRNLILILGFAGLSMLIIAGAAEAQANPKADVATTGRSLVKTAAILAPTTAPTSAPLADPSPESQKALEYISQQQGIPIEQLVVANAFRRSAPLLNRTFQAVTVLATQGGRFFQILVDLDSGSSKNARLSKTRKRGHPTPNTASSSRRCTSAYSNSKILIRSRSHS